MSPSLFDTSALRKRWFHMPAFAVIAVAATLVILSHKAADLWIAWKRPPTVPRTIDLVGRAELTGLAPDRVAWSVGVNASNKSEAAVAQLLVEQTRQVVQQLRDSGVADADIRVRSSVISELDQSGSFGEPARPSVYLGEQQIEIQSKRIAVSLDGYAAVVRQATASTTVEPPECWREDDAAVRKQVQEAAWTDLRRQADLVSSRLGRSPLGRLVAVAPSDVELLWGRDTWACSDGQTAHASIAGSYELR